MAVSIVWPAVSRGEEVWIASHEVGRARRYFGNLGSVRDFFATKFAGAHTNWEEMAYDPKTDSDVNLDAPNRRTQMDMLAGCRVVSGLTLLTSSVRFAGEYPTERWEDTGWRVWRAQ